MNATDHPTGPIWEVIGGLSRFAALAALTELGGPEHLRDAALTPAELAERCGADADALARVLRELAGTGVVASAPGGRYTLTPAGETLCADAPDSMRAAVLMNAGPELRYALDNLPRTVREGRSAFVAEHGTLYEHLSDRPERARLFDDYMTSRAVPHRQAVADRYDFSGVTTLVDVGGGKGHFLSTVLAAHPHLRGVLFDLDHVAAAARDHLKTAGLVDRTEVVGGDFFTGELPAGADAYLLGSVLHNWSDDDAVRILSSVRAAMAPSGRVLVLEYALPDDDRPHVGLDGDIRMLALFGDGAERTRAQYGALLERADLRLDRVIDLPGGVALLEARPLSVEG
ncbi:methyltransferase [Actinomadura hibisca]|uniref:methyltransferase n=1 Tax=Actinomadura hibisca TaxID=68565 RepID=UPI0008342E2A|nr:methyltransferase [Actinomadura hibisca]